MSSGKRPRQRAFGFRGTGRSHSRFVAASEGEERGVVGLFIAIVVFSDLVREKGGLHDGNVLCQRRHIICRGCKAGVTRQEEVAVP